MLQKRNNMSDTINNHSSTVLQKENYNSLETNFKVMGNCDLNDREFKIAVTKKLNVIQKTEKGDPAIPLLGIYPKNPETLIQKNICIPMFIAALFTIAKIWKQPKCPSVGEWIKKPWYIYTIKYYTAVKKKET